VEEQNAQHSHGHDLFSPTNMFRDKFLFLLFGKVSHALLRIEGDDTECTRHGGILRESLPICVRSAEENCEMES